MKIGDLLCVTGGASALVTTYKFMEVVQTTDGSTLGSIFFGGAFLVFIQLAFWTATRGLIMIIERTPPKEEVLPPYRTLAPGAVFLLVKNGNPFIKSYPTNEGVHKTNCVNLLDGARRFVNPDTVVIPQPHAKVVF